MTPRAFVSSTLSILVAGIALSAAAADAQPVIEPTNHHPNPYQTINDYFELPDQREWGSTSAVAIDPDGTSIWVAERCGANSCAGSDVDPILKYDADGNVVTSFGAGMFIWPHGFHVDDDGNVWVTDARGPSDREQEMYPDAENKGHAVYKFSPEGEVLLTLGEPGNPGDGSGPLLNAPNDVITAPNGDIFVAESHGGQSASADWNTVARIAKFDSDGEFITSWGEIGAAPGQFRTPHGLALDSRGRLFVADRGNARIQIFDQDGNFLDEWYQFGRLSGIYIDDDDILYAADSESSPTSNPGWIRGIRVGSAVTGHVLYFIPDPQMPDPSSPPGGTSAAEGVAADADGNIYGAEVGPRQLVKYVREDDER